MCWKADKQEGPRRMGIRNVVKSLSRMRNVGDAEDREQLLWQCLYLVSSDGSRLTNGNNGPVSFKEPV